MCNRSAARRGATRRRCRSDALHDAGPPDDVCHAVEATVTTPSHTAAHEYLARGWAVLPLFSTIDRTCGCGDPQCKNPGKHPLGSLVYNGLHGASKFPAQIDKWWWTRPEANIGIRTGAASNLVVIDIDDKAHEGRDGSQTWRRLLAAHADGMAPDTVEAITGSGGRHLYFLAPDGIDVTSSKDALGPGLDVRGENGYVVAPPSAHVSGREYTWESSSHPDDVPVAPMPDWLVRLCRTRIPRTAEDVGLRLTAVLDPLEVAEIRSALASFGSDDRDLWVSVGMALHGTNAGAQGQSLWEQWSATSAKYDAKDAGRVWRSFKGRLDGVTTASIYHHAQQSGWVRPPLKQLARAAGVTLPEIYIPAVVVSPPPPVRLPALVVATNPLAATLPGQLQDMAAWSLATAPRPEPVYAVAAALAAASTMIARRYTTVGQNYGSLYFLVVGRSGTGKEHVRTSVESMFRAVLAPSLIGPNAFTSASAVWSAVLQAPQSCAIIDEFGQFLAAASGGSDGAQMKDGVLTTLMELWGRVASSAQTPQFSTLAMSEKQRDSIQRKSIDRPGMSLVGLTTPAMWYMALKSARVANGFLNRFCVLHGSDKRQPFMIAEPVDVPTGVAMWGQSILAPRGNLDTIQRPTEIPGATVLDMPTTTSRLFQAFDHDCMAEADRLEFLQLGELPMRSNEQAMRLALMAALAEDPHATTITPTHATWGIDVARWILDQLVPSVQSQMADNPLHALRNQFLSALDGAGNRGMTQREINRLGVFKGATRRDRDETVAWALETQHASWDLRTHDGAGRPARILTIMTNEETA